MKIYDPLKQSILQEQHLSKNIVILKIKLTTKNAANTVFPETLFQQ